MKVTYFRYLRSDAWREKRRLVLERDGYRCQLWHAHVATEVHHTTYAHLGYEPLEDLISLCRACHEAITAVLRRERHRARRLHLQETTRLTPLRTASEYTYIPHPAAVARVTPLRRSHDDGIPDLTLQTYQRRTAPLS
jgi:5-methylcytosine-specific restriction endonuclease McrA